MFGSTVHDSVFGSKMFAAGKPTWVSICPPTTRTRPSAICSCPLQKMFAGAGTESTVLVIGFQAIAVEPKDWPSHSRILPVDKSAALTDTSGNGTVPDQTPDCAGLPGLELENVTDTELAFAVLFAKSQADAVSVCVPLANF